MILKSEFGTLNCIMNSLSLKKLKKNKNKKMQLI